MQFFSACDEMQLPIDFRDGWLHEMSLRIQIPELAFNDDGICQIVLDDEFAITIFKHPKNCSLILSGQVPVKNMSPELMQKMLIENRYDAQRASPVISISEDMETIDLHFRLNKEDINSADDILMQLICHLEYWRGNSL